MTHSRSTPLIGNSNRFVFIFCICTVIICSVLAWSDKLDAEVAAEPAIFIYEFNRSKVPAINDYTLTLLIDVGDATEISVENLAEKSIPFELLADSQQILITTDESTLQVTLEGVSVSDIDAVGNIDIARLKNNKQWAWSHSFDDNHYLEGPIGVMQALDLPATMYIVGSWIDSGPAWDGNLDEEEILDLFEGGWSLGNHTFDHDNNCGIQPDQANRRDGILRTDEALKALIARSSRADYKVISFAVPCGGQDRFEAYHDLLADMRAEKSTDILFDEGGHDEPLYITVTDDFDFEALVKRDLAIDGSEDNAADLKAIFDSISQLSLESSDQVYWYNSFSHGSQTFGDNTVKLNDVASYFVRTYGRNGSGEAWMAPADEIYSYLLVREFVEISTSKDLPAASTPTPLPPTPLPPTSTAAPTQASPPQPTPTFDFATSTPSRPTAGNITPKAFLPLARIDNS